LLAHPVPPLLPAVVTSCDANAVYTPTTLSPLVANPSGNRGLRRRPTPPSLIPTGH
jgi:hypothetical protein